MATVGVPTYYLSWGMISLPIKTYIAARDERSPLVNMHGACAKDGQEAKLNSLSKCSCCGEMVEKDQVVKAFKVGKGKAGSYVLFTQDEVEALSVESSKTMEVLGFVEVGTIDPVYLGRSDYIGPNDPSGAKPFALLREAMKKADVEAVVKYAGSGKDKIGLIRFSPLAPEALILHELFYENEVRSFQDQTRVTVSGVVSDAELNLAMQLIETGCMDLTVVKQQSDSFQDRLKALIATRIAGVDAPVIEVKPAAAPTLDLMAALKASLEAKKAGAV